MKRTYLKRGISYIWNALLFPNETNTSMTIAIADVDECLSLVSNNCSDRCENVVGSYMCTCSPGYRLEEDLTTCIGEKY